MQQIRNIRRLITLTKFDCDNIKASVEFQFSLFIIIIEK